MNTLKDTSSSPHVRVAFLEDDDIVGNILINALTEAGFAVDWFKSGLECIRSIQRQQYAVCVLDWMVPDVVGPDVLRAIRESRKSSDLPIVFVTSRAEEHDVLSMLAIGADDYITKPVSAAILVARVTALLRRSGQATRGQKKSWGPLCVNFSSRTIFFDDVKIVLTKREMELALFLLENTERLLTRTMLLKAVWQHSSTVESRKIDVCISTLRKKLNLTPTYGWQLSSVYGEGYRLEWIGKSS
ncbi:response regulator transcription factor [Rhodoferax aquaticus]|uniref:Response regulator transcription factor n=1 Tax=Rhodoferax aquaticus TaxID=2527691 RepID=A0A515ESY2_9BURK|nr:response regulator transcription factor [Rhodoferax aquaticus]QDL55761.1 response regulator transcription factor [Rhodoferax aquaticus]